MNNAVESRTPLIAAPPTTLTTDAAAAYVGLASKTLEKRRIAGTGPKFLKLGRAVRYRVADLDVWLSARAVSSTSERVAA